MARPIKQGMDYFPHDVDARNDIKIKKLRLQYGIEGYGVYFMVLEMIYRSKNYELSLETEEDIMVLADECRLDTDKFVAIIEKCCDLGLFDKHLYSEGKKLSSNAVKKRTETVENKRNRNKKHYSVQKEIESEENKNSFSQVSDAEISLKSDENLSESTQSKEKKSKEKENKNNVVVMRTRANDQQSMSIYDYFTHCGFGTVAGHTAERLDDMAQCYSEPWLRLALEEADNQGAHNLAYVKAILERWRSQGGPDQPKNRGKPSNQRGGSADGKTKPNARKAAQKAEVDWEAERKNGF